MRWIKDGPPVAGAVVRIKVAEREVEERRERKRDARVWGYRKMANFCLLKGLNTWNE